MAGISGQLTDFEVHVMSEIMASHAHIEQLTKQCAETAQQLEQVTKERDELKERLSANSF